MLNYEQVKACVVDVVDDFTPKDVTANFAPAGQANFNAKTRLITLAINETTLAGMTIRFNKALRQVCGVAWHDVGSFDLVQLTTIGQCIQLACAKSGVNVPIGEPK